MIGLQTGTSAWQQAIDVASALGQNYWWVAVLAALAWYLRWYGYAMKNNMDGAAYWGLYGAAKNIAITLQNAGKYLILLAAGILLGLGFVFDISSTLLVGLGGLDPMVWAITALGGFFGLEAADVSFVTATNAFLVFIGTFALVLLLRWLKRFGSQKARRQARMEEMDDDADSTLLGGFGRGLMQDDD